MTEVTARDWYKTGFSDGRNGNPKWLPDPAYGKQTKDQYLAGFKAGRSELELQIEQMETDAWIGAHVPSQTIK